MGSINCLLETLSESAGFGVSQIMKPASQNDFNAGSAMNQPTDPAEVFRFLDLPRELRDKIYRDLLLHDKPVELKRSPLFEIGKKCRYYETRLGLAPQICRISKKVACESFTLLYGENTFHFTSHNSIFAVYDLGLNIYSHLVKSIQVDTFRPEFKLYMQSGHWATHDAFTKFFDNLRKLRFNLPQALEILSENGKISLLEAKRYTPKYAVVEFYGATPDIVMQLTTAWSKHIPKEEEYPKRVPQPFNPLEWSKKQEREQERSEHKQLLSPPVSVRPVRTVELKRQSPNECPGEESLAKKKQKLDDEILRHNLGLLDGSSEHIGKVGSRIYAEARLRASDETGLAAEERTLASKEKSLAEEKMALEKKKLAIEKEGLALEKKKLTLENERLALEKKRLAVDEKIPPSPASTVSI